MSGAGRNVVVADDDEDIRLLCRINLEAAGFTVHEAANADETLRVCKQAQPVRVVLLDVTMPGRDGFECLALLKADPEIRDVPVVMLSGHVSDSSRDLALSLGAAEYVQKPFRPADLAALVTRLAGSE